MMRTGNCSPHLPLMKILAHQALVVAMETSVRQPAAGGSDRPPPCITAALPAAQLLADDESSVGEPFTTMLRTVSRWLQRDAESPDRRWLMLHEPSGHSREVYLPLVLHLAMLAWEKKRSKAQSSEIEAGEQMIRQMGRWLDRWRFRGEPTASAPDISLGLWLALLKCDHALLQADAAALAQADELAQQWLAEPGEEGSLHRLDPQQSLDGWTYQEFTGLHALMNLAIRRERDSWRIRAAQAAEHHVRNSQPDNTTTQPWALLAFLHGSDTASLGEQQLHDARTQGLNALTGLLLADALAMAAIVV